MKERAATVSPLFEEKRVRNTQTFMLLIGFAMSACGDAPEPAVASAVAEATEVGSPATAIPPVESIPEAFVTHKAADPSRMPNDAIHGGLRRAAPSRQMPPGHPPIGSQRPPRAPHAPVATMVPRGGAVEKGVERPLTLKGPGSVAELEARKKRVPQGDGQADRIRDLDTLYRISFTTNRAKRDHAKAQTLAAALAKHTSTAATAARVQGFLAVSTGFDTKSARTHYERAIELDAQYGEAHYALAFLCALDDRESGAKHFARASAAGVEDTMSLARIYADSTSPKTPTPKPGH